MPTNQPTPVILSDEQITQMVTDMQAQLSRCSSTGMAYRVKWHDVKEIIATIQTLQERLAEAKKWQMSVEEREAAVCPEDVGFDEYIRTLRSHWLQAEHQRNEALDQCTELHQRLAQVEKERPQTRQRPVGWISCGLRRGHDRAVDMIFENAECAKAFIDGIEPAVGPIVAATQMRDKCVALVREMRGEWHDQYVAADSSTREALVRKEMLFAQTCAARDIITALESLTLDVEQKEAK